MCLFKVERREMHEQRIPRAYSESVLPNRIHMGFAYRLHCVFREKRKTNPPSLEPYVKSGEIKKHGDYFSVPELVAYENATAIGAMRLQYANAKKYYPEDLIRKYIKQFEDEENEGRKLHYHQADAVIMAINANFCVLTGGPGTGKTTVVSCIIYCMRKILGAEVNICLTAPTGKAARVLRGSTGENATTFHKRFNVTFTSRSGSTFYEDVLFVDESSFADIEMASILFNNVPDGRKVVLSVTLISFRLLDQELFCEILLHPDVFRLQC